MVCICTSLGLHAPFLFPSETGPDYSLTPYLEILKVRMEDRLQTSINVPEGLLSAEFPSMMIQSLVENAIKHGLEPKAEGGQISVSATITSDGFNTRSTRRTANT